MRSTGRRSAGSVARFSNVLAARLITFKGFCRSCATTAMTSSRERIIASSSAASRGLSFGLAIV